MPHLLEKVCQHVEPPQLSISNGSSVPRFDYPTVDAIAGFALAQILPTIGGVQLPMQMTNFNVSGESTEIAHSYYSS